MNAVNKYYDQVAKAILSTNEFGITEVRELTDIKVMELNRKDYPTILEIVKSRDISAIRSLPSPYPTDQAIFPIGNRWDKFAGKNMHGKINSRSNV